jgi:NAD(P)-dependent dehydrogenase (short-subunit alcohol dehydrogenase family)
LISIGTTATAEHFASGSGSYSAFKSAVTNWTLGQAQVLGARGIRCNVVSPGPIYIEGGDWNMIKDHMADFYNATAKAHPGGELGTAQDVADVIAFLASDRARHVNGVNVTVDGGFLKRVDF